jgi:hypothetical protein
MTEATTTLTRAEAPLRLRLGETGTRTVEWPNDVVRPRDRYEDS